MSQETLAWLQENTRIGFTAKRGAAWHAARGADGEYRNHFEGPVPLEEVTGLMSYELVEAEITATALTQDGVISTVDPDRKAIMRADNGVLFGIFSKRGYRIHEPQKWCVDTVSSILDTSSSDLNIGSAGLLKQGAQAFVQFELADTFESIEGVKHRPFLTAATSHDGSLATTYITGTTVVVCDNTLSLALSRAEGKFKVRHSTNSLNKIGEVRASLDLVVEEAGDAFDAEVRELMAQSVSQDKWKRFVKAYVNPSGKELEGRGLTMAETKEAALNRLWNYDERVAPWRGNAFGVVSAVNTYVHHEQNVKGVGRVERNMSRMILGEFDKIDSSTLKLLERV
jgi:phage/plasmid-like protein (TIGR03299 family)